MSFPAKPVPEQARKQIIDMLTEGYTKSAIFRETGIAIRKITEIAAELEDSERNTGFAIDLCNEWLKQPLIGGRYVE